MALQHNIAIKTDKTTYNDGEKITISYTGSAQDVSDVPVNNMTVTIAVDGVAQNPVPVPPFTVKGVTKPLTVKFTGVTDPTGVTSGWAPSADGQTITGTA